MPTTTTTPTPTTTSTTTTTSTSTTTTTPTSTTTPTPTPTPTSTSTSTSHIQISILQRSFFPLCYCLALNPAPIRRTYTESAGISRKQPLRTTLGRGSLFPHIIEIARFLASAP